MVVPRDYHTKRRKSEKDKYHTISPICGILKKKYTNELNCKIEKYSDIENNLRLLKEKGGGKG